MRTIALRPARGFWPRMMAQEMPDFGHATDGKNGCRQILGYLFYLKDIEPKYFNKLIN